MGLDHVTRFSDLVDLWVIKIKKSQWSFAHVVHRDQVNRARNTDDAARTCERFVYSTVKITRLHDYQTWQTHFSRNSRGAQRFVGFFSWLCVSDADWLDRRTQITWNGGYKNSTKKRWVLVSSLCFSFRQYAAFISSSQTLWLTLWDVPSKLSFLYADLPHTVKIRAAGGQVIVGDGTIIQGGDYRPGRGNGYWSLLTPSRTERFPVLNILFPLNV